MKPSRPSVDLGGEAVARQAGEKIGRDPQGIGHAALGNRGMDVHAADRDLDGLRREGLDVELVAAVAVDRVADHGADAADLDMIHAAADLLVAGKAEPDRPVDDLADAPSSTGPLP